MPEFNPQLGTKPCSSLSELQQWPWLTDMMNQREKMFSAQETAQILGLCLDSVRRHFRSGKLPAVRVGRNWRIAESQLSAYLGLDTPGTTETGSPPEPAPLQIEPLPEPSRAVGVGQITRESRQDAHHMNEAVALLLRTDVGRAQINELVSLAAERRHLRPQTTNQLLDEINFLLRQR